MCVSANLGSSVKYLFEAIFFAIPFGNKILHSFWSEIYFTLLALKFFVRRKSFGLNPEMFEIF